MHDITHRDPVLLRKVEAMTSEQIIEQFAEALAHDLTEQGMSPADVEAARLAAVAVLEHCGIRERMALRRRTGLERKPIGPVKAEARRARCAQRRAARDAAKRMKPAIVARDDAPIDPRIVPTPLSPSRRHSLGLARMLQADQDQEPDERIAEARDDGSGQPGEEAGKLAA